MTAEVTDGLKEKQREAIIGILSANPRVEKAVLFGSRATGTFTAQSDVDIALFGKSLSHDDLSSLSRKMDESTVPQRVYLLIHENITSPKLRDHIRRQGKVLFQRAACGGEGNAGCRGGGDEWKETVLAGVIDVKHGFAFPGRNIRDEPPGDILLTPGNFAIGGGFKGDKYKYFDGEVLDDYVLNKDDLIVTMTDLSKQADTLGFPAIVPEQRGPRYLHNQRLGKVLIKPNAKLDKRFLFYLLRTSDYRNEILASATGTTVKHTSPNRILAHKANIPPLHTQRAIAHVLGTLDDKIELNRRMNRTLEKMAAAIFKSWFIDFDPVRAKAEGRDTGLPAEIADLFPDSFEDSELGEIPKGWSVKPIGDAVRCVGGATPSTKNPKFWEGGRHPFVTPKDMSSLQSPVILDSERHITDAGVDKISSKQVPVGTVILSSRAPIGYLAVAAIPVSVNQGVIAMICDGDLPNLYILHWTAANMALIKSRAGGTTFSEISKRNFRPIPVLAPVKPVLDAFMVNVAPLHERITLNIRQNRRLAGIRDTLLPKLLSGEIEAPEMDAVDGGAGAHGRAPRVIT